MAGGPVTVREIMTERVVTIDPDSTLLDAAKLMKSKRIGSLVVTQKDEIVGIITESDFIRVASEEIVPRASKVKDVMSKPVITCAPDIPIAELAKLMGRKRFATFLLLKTINL